MKVIAPFDCYLVALNRPVTGGETVDVPEADGLSLVEQGWRTPAVPKPSKPKAVEAD